MSVKKCIKIISYPNEDAFDQVLSIASRLYKKKTKEELEVILKKTPVRLNLSENVFNKLFEILVKIGCQIEDCSVSTEPVSEKRSDKLQESSGSQNNNISESLEKSENSTTATNGSDSEKSFVSSEESKETPYEDNREVIENKTRSENFIGENNEKSDDNISSDENNYDQDPVNENVTESEIGKTFFYFDNWGENGFFQSLWDSFVGVIFHPSDFFANLPKPVWYNLLFFYIIFTIIPLGSSLAILKSILMSIVTKYSFAVSSFFVLLLFYLVIIFFFEVVNIHFSIIVFGKGRGIKRTMQIVSYLSVVKIFNIIPIFGSIVSFYLYIVYLTTSLVKVHKFSIPRAVAASLFPVFLMVFFVIFVIFFIIVFLGGNNAQSIFNIMGRFNY